MNVSHILGIVMNRKILMASKDTTFSSPPGSGVCHWTISVLISVWGASSVRAKSSRFEVLTETKVPGRKNNVTSVIIRMKIASCFICCVMNSTWSAEYCALPASSLLASTFRYSRIPYNCFTSALIDPFCNKHIPMLSDLPEGAAESPAWPFAFASQRECVRSGPQIV